MFDPNFFSRMKLPYSFDGLIIILMPRRPRNDENLKTIGILYETLAAALQQVNKIFSIEVCF